MPFGSSGLSVLPGSAFFSNIAFTSILEVTLLKSLSQPLNVYPSLVAFAGAGGRLYGELGSGQRASGF